MNFKEYLKEYYVAPLSTVGLTKAQIEPFLDDAKELTSIKFGDKEFLILVAKYWNTVFFILKDSDEIIAYLNVLKFKNTTFYQVQTVEIFTQEFKGKGLGKSFYTSIINAGFQLLNGTSLSIPAEGLWKSLIKTHGKTYDAKEDKILPLDDQPVIDKIKPDSGEQRYFWLLSK